MKKLNQRHVDELQKALVASNRKADREIARLKKRLQDQRVAAKEKLGEMQALFVCKVALAAVVSSYYAAKMGDKRCQGQLDETLKMAADVLLITDPGIKDVETFCGTVKDGRKRLCGGKPS